MMKPHSIGVSGYRDGFVHFNMLVGTTSVACTIERSRFMDEAEIAELPEGDFQDAVRRHWEAVSRAATREYVPGKPLIQLRLKPMVPHLPNMNAPARLWSQNPERGPAGVVGDGAFGDLAKAMLALQPGSPATYWVDCLGTNYRADELVEADRRGLIVPLSG